MPNGMHATVAAMLERVGSPPCWNMLASVGHDVYALRDSRDLSRRDKFIYQ